MGHTIAVMNAKGGVGKSTVVQALAETLAGELGKRVLVVDSDAQGSVSYMLAGPQRFTAMQNSERTLLQLIAGAVLGTPDGAWTKYVVEGVSDLDEMRGLSLLPSSTELTLLEREISRAQKESEVRTAIRGMLSEMKAQFDYVFIDCPPGLSIVTETWLREADYYIAPTRPDYISACGLLFFNQFRQRNPEMGFAKTLGVLVSMKDERSSLDQEFHAWLKRDPQNRCFETVLPRALALQHAGSYVPAKRSYLVKYPGEAGQAVRKLASEVIIRTSSPIK
jgi:chromosome partitioning protein